MSHPSSSRVLPLLLSTFNPRPAMKLPSFDKPLRVSRSRVLWKLAKAALDRDRPVLVQIVVTRRCNLACGYCYEYDKVSKPVPLP